MSNIITMPSREVKSLAYMRQLSHVTTAYYQDPWQDTKMMLSFISITQLAV